MRFKENHFRPLEAEYYETMELYNKQNGIMRNKPFLNLIIIYILK